MELTSSSTETVLAAEPNVDTCCETCAASPTCTGFVISAEMCYLKDGALSQQDKTGRIAYVRNLPPSPPTPPPQPACQASVALGSCAGPSEPCFYDPRCLATSTEVDPYGGLGCEAGGHEGCRFCGFGLYGDVACPVDPAVEDGGVQATMTFAGDVSMLNDPVAVDQFKLDLKSDLSTLLGIDEDRIVVLDVRAGSLVVELVIAQPADGSTAAGVSALDALNTLETAVNSPNAPTLGGLAPQGIAVVATEPTLGGSASANLAAGSSSSSLSGVSYGAMGAAALIVILISWAIRRRRLAAHKRLAAKNAAAAFAAKVHGTGEEQPNFDKDRFANEWGSSEGKMLRSMSLAGPDDAPPDFESIVGAKSTRRAVNFETDRDDTSHGKKSHRTGEDEYLGDLPEQAAMSNRSRHLKQLGTQKDLTARPGLSRYKSHKMDLDGPEKGVAERPDSMRSNSGRRRTPTTPNRNDPNGILPAPAPLPAKGLTSTDRSRLASMRADRFTAAGDGPLSSTRAPVSTSRLGRRPSAIVRDAGVRTDRRMRALEDRAAAMSQRDAPKDDDYLGDLADTLDDKADAPAIPMRSTSPLSKSRWQAAGNKVKSANSVVQAFKDSQQVFPAASRLPAPGDTASRRLVNATEAIESTEISVDDLDVLPTISGVRPRPKAVVILDEEEEYEGSSPRSPLTAAYIDDEDEDEEEGEEEVFMPLTVYASPAPAAAELKALEDSPLGDADKDALEALQRRLTRRESSKTSLASAVERARLSPSASSRPRSLSMRNLSMGQTGSARRNSLPMPKTADDAVLTSRGPKAEAIMEAPPSLPPPLAEQPHALPPPLAEKPRTLPPPVVAPAVAPPVAQPVVPPVATLQLAASGGLSGELNEADKAVLEALQRKKRRPATWPPPAQAPVGAPVAASGKSPRPLAPGTKSPRTDRDRVRI